MPLASKTYSHLTTSTKGGQKILLIQPIRRVYISVQIRTLHLRVTTTPCTRHTALRK